MTRLAVPWYVHPAESPEQWQQLAALGDRLEFVVVNVADGPGAANDPYYPEALAMLRAHGVRLIGYVDVDYGRRGVPRVAADVRAWLELYAVDGIMYDQVASGIEGLGHNRLLAGLARRAGMRTVVANPGVEPCAGLLDLFDVTCVFEDDAAAHARVESPGPGIAPEKRWHLVHGVPVGELDTVAARAEELGAGLVYVTDRPAPHPWDRLPLEQVQVERC
ncbi:MAG TPA: spherulation-specific family 4 protein [Kribbella sp.]|uniref:spherulation-specific family 4 protein n=1 Tax=Kribbella sp. TaxID=1871183 RepID=UPI002D78E49B|nr:spherulation-specific family 4 protein [Kribbella sp.]HET6293225.1 spherulation-specific family 4 protein [Kribbella sp.]